MKHNHDAEVNINLEIPKEEMEELIDKATDSAIKIIVVFTATQIIKSLFTQRTP